MSENLSLSRLIIEALESGYDVEVRVTKAKGDRGGITIPIAWGNAMADANQLDEDTIELIGGKKK